MKKLLLALTPLLALSTFAMTLDVPRLPAPAFADREVAGDTAITANAHDHLYRILR